MGGTEPVNTTASNTIDASKKTGIIERLIALLIGLLGAAMAAGGAQLALLGGALYYVLVGPVMVISAWLIWRGRPWGHALYALVCLITIIWALGESWLNGWALVPRLGLILGLGLALLVTRALRGNGGAFRMATLALIGLLVAGFAISLYSARGSARADHTASPLDMASTDWIDIGGDGLNQRFSQLNQITPENVAGLKVAWTANLAKDGQLGGVLEATPIKIGDTLYMCDMANRVHALDAETGKSRWVFTPESNGGDARLAVCRGVTYARVEDMAEGEHCASRIILTAADARLIAMDAKDGKLCQDFGSKGEVSTLQGLSPAPPGYYYHTSPVIHVRGKLVLGASVLDGQSVDEPSGVIRAFDARTGAFIWAWDMGRPEESGLPPEGEYFTPGTPNAWAPLAADEANGLVFAPLGNATPDYVMSHRTPAMNTYGSSVVAIDTETGKLRWHFQTVHLDQWDYDVASPPTLIDYPMKDGTTRPALIQPTKRGQTFVLDRLTGNPLVPVVERKVPTDGVPTETFSPTQPYSTLPSMFGEELSEKKMWGMTPLDQLWCRIKFRQARYEGEFTPIMADRASIIYPSYIGGSNWSGVAFDPSRNLLAVNVNHFPMYNRLIPRDKADEMGIEPYEPGVNELDVVHWAQMGTPWAMDNKKFMGPLGTPCNEPPYGTLGLIDLNTGKLAWQKPLGKARDTGPFGLRTGLPFAMGTPQLGGALMTGSGLMFIGGTQERTFRAMNTETGEILWEDRLPAGAHANPMTYYSDASGRQFVVVAASGHYQFANGNSDLLIAYALPSGKTAAN